MFVSQKPSSFFPTSGRVQSLSEVCLSMLPAARTPKTKSMPEHFNIEGQASLNDLCRAQFENRLPLFVGLGINIFHRGRQNHGMCASVATGALGNRSDIGSSIQFLGRP